MERYQEEFIEFMLDSDVLQFGHFVTKSGRNTPFFINTGLYRTGGQLRKLGSFYAKAIKDFFGTGFDVLFGPSYKGIPLAVSACMALDEQFGANVRYCSNRKEVKDHGDAGILLGGPIRDGDRVLMIEDVTTSGKSIRETVPIIKAQGNVTIAGLVVSVDRMERGTGSESAVREIEKEFGFPVHAIVTMADVIEALSGKEKDGKRILTDEIREEIDAYYEQYGAKDEQAGF